MSLHPEIVASPSRAAAVLMVISTVNWLAMAVYTIVLIAINALVYYAAHGHPPDRHSLDGSASDSVGLYPFPVPWEVFALGGAVMLFIAVATWPAGRRIERPSTGRVKMVQTGAAFLATMGFFGAGVMIAVIGNYDGLLTAFDPYLIGPVLALIAGFISLRRWQLDAPGVPDSGVPNARSSPAAAVLGALVLADLVGVVVLGFGGVAVNQAIYLASHGGDLPPGVHRWSAGTDIWAGHMPVTLPWTLFVALSGLLLLITLVTWPRRLQFGPGLNRRVFFRRTSPPPLIVIGLLIFGIEATVDLFYGSGAASAAAFRGPAIAAIAAGVALVRWVTNPLLTSMSRRRASKAARAQTNERW